MPLLVGDSIGLSIDDNLPGNYVVDAVVGRSFATGLAVVKARKAAQTLPPRVIIELGTNGPISLMDMSEMLQTLKGHQVWFVNNYLPPQYSYLTTNNRQIAKAASTVNGLVRWKRMASAHPEWFATDPMHIHPNGDGQAALAAAIVKVVNG